MVRGKGGNKRGRGDVRVRKNNHKNWTCMEGPVHIVVKVAKCTITVLVYALLEVLFVPES